jgi:DNA repair photolyase
MKPIYEPKGRAKEYGELAINLHGTCPHRCFYCYAPSVLHKTKEEFFDYKGYRSGIVEETKRQLENEGIKNKLIHLPFIGDAYPKGHDSSITREIIKLLKDYDNHVQILTKNGMDAERDFDLLDGEDWFGVTIAGYPEGTLFEVQMTEPGAGTEAERLAALDKAHKQGIKTWISFEPVLDANAVLNFLELNVGYVDKYKIGKLNYYPSDINWKDFGIRATRICRSWGLDFYIKDDLKKLMASSQ